MYNHLLGNTPANRKHIFYSYFGDGRTTEHTDCIDQLPRGIAKELAIFCYDVLGKLSIREL